jgi:hypothetical protein
MAHESITPERETEITTAREMWREWANGERSRAEKGFATHASAEQGFAVVRAYDMELLTGKPHCSCCFKPTGDNRMAFQ